MLVGNNGGPPLLLRNNAAKRNNWLGLKLQGVTCNRDAVGTKIVWKAGGQTFQRLKNSGGSFLSAHDPREVLGFGRAAKLEEVEIHWAAPSNKVDRLTNVPVNRYCHVVEGKGIVAETG